jgi:hypothetical protein
LRSCHRYRQHDAVPNVPIRDVPADDAVDAQTVELRRRAALATTAQRLRGRPEVPERERRAVLDAIADAHTERVDDLGDRSAR